MAFVHKNSSECTKSELDLFSLPGTQASLTRASWIQFQPLTNIVDAGPIEFVINGSSDTYLDLAQTMLHVQAKIVGAD